MEERSTIRLCYILPRYESASGSHFFYLYELLERAQHFLQLLVIVERAGVGVKHFPFPVYIQKFRFPPFRAVELLFLVCRERIHGTKYFYTHYSFFGAVVTWFVTRFFGGTAYYWNCGMPWLYRRLRMAEFVFRFILRHTVLVTGTESIAEEYRRHYGLLPSNIRILPNWINLQRWNIERVFSREAARSRIQGMSGITSSKKIVLFVHRLSRRKGAHRILPVATAVTKERPDVIFLIVGIGPDYENLKLEIRNLKLESNVIMAGEVPNKDLLHYFAAADVFFMPSEEEGFPHVLLEAMATGIPYVASDVGGVQEITSERIRDFLVSDESVDTYSRKIVQLLDMAPDERAKMAAEERKWVTRYSIEVALSVFTALFGR